MAQSIGPQMPVEVGYHVLRARDIVTGVFGEIWTAGAMTTDYGYLEQDSVD